MQVYKPTLQDLLDESRPGRPIYMTITFEPNAAPNRIIIHASSLDKHDQILHLPYVFYEGEPLEELDRNRMYWEAHATFSKIEDTIHEEGFETSDGLLSDEMVPSYTW